MPWQTLIGGDVDLKSYFKFSPLYYFSFIKFYYSLLAPNLYQISPSFNEITENGQKD